ncbi:MAG: type II secretion system protein [Synergistaceae bacterium]|nr:type II secretion system protein [Synergistaceae bacterium]
MKSQKRKGFTLVELLIVIVVIGVLSAMMMLSSTEAVTSAKATKIVSDMLQIKKAATEWYLDHYEQFQYVDKNKGFLLDGKTDLHTYLKNNPSELAKYFSNAEISANGGLGNYSSENNNEYYAAKGGYALYMGKSNTVCYVVYKISDHNEASEEGRLKSKLQARARQSGLLSYKFGKDRTSTSKEYNGKDANVFMEVFKLGEYN